MHYRNGREAKNGDKVVKLSIENGVIVSFGVLHSATPGNDYCDGSIAPITNDTMKSMILIALAFSCVFPFSGATAQEILCFESTMNPLDRKYVAPAIEAAKQDGISFRTVNADREPALAKKYLANDVHHYQRGWIPSDHQFVAVDSAGKIRARMSGWVPDMREDFRRMWRDATGQACGTGTCETRFNDVHPKTARNIAGPVILDFTAPWCGPCQAMKPIVANAKAKGANFRAIDVDVDPALAKQFRAESIPLFVSIDASGNEVRRIEGTTSAHALGIMWIEITKKP